jgi:hypothetical protein
VLRTPTLLVPEKGREGSDTAELNGLLRKKNERVGSGRTLTFEMVWGNDTLKKPTWCLWHFVYV